MEIAKVEVGRTTGVCTRRERIPAGIAGASVQVSFTDPVWDNLIKTVVFRGKGTKIAEFDGAVAEIPHEVIPEPRIAQYLDWQSAIDHFCYTCLLGAFDLMKRNHLLVTLDGTKWYFSAYDLDSTFGLEWTGDSFRSPNTCLPMPDTYWKHHRLMELIWKYKKDELKERYAYLRENLLSTGKVHADFYNFTAKIPSILLNEDWKKWQTIPNTSGNTIAQIMDWYRSRVEVLDKVIERL